MNIFLSAANDWNVIDICNKFLFVKLEFIAFISLLQNNRAGIPLNLLIKKKKKHSHKIFFNIHLVTKLIERNRRFTILPPTVLILYPLFRYILQVVSPETWNTCLTSGQIYGSSYISSSNSAYNVFNFPIRDYPTVSTCIIPSPFYDLPFPRRATANFLVACGCPLLFALNRIVSNRLLILAWTRGRESFKEGSFSMYVCVCVCTRSSGVHIFWYIYSWFRDWFMVVRINCTETIILSVDYFS